MNLNKAFIIGNLTRDPEIKTLPSGNPVVNFGVATNRVWTNQAGQKQEEVQFHNIVSFGKQAETINQYLKKGSMIFIEGRIQTRNWEAQDGTKRSRTEIITERVQFGPKKFSPNNPNTPNQPSQQKEETLDTIEYPEDHNDPNEVPF
jgi:single-strand DNA-binding protein